LEVLLVRLYTGEFYKEL